MSNSKPLAECKGMTGQICHGLCWLKALASLIPFGGTRADS